MSPPDLYEADFHAWSAAQAEALRRLAGLGGNAGIDWDNLIEEVESLGRSERQAVESLWMQVFIHLLKLALCPNDPAHRHWQSEILGFLFQADQHYCPSMAQLLTPRLETLWQRARRIAATLGCEISRCPETCPFDVPALLAASRAEHGLEDLLARLEPQP